MRLFEKIKIKIKEFKNSTQKKGSVLIALVLSIIVLVIFGCALKGGEKDTKQDRKIETQTCGMQDFILATESRLEHILGLIKGVGDVNVFIMANQSSEFVYLTDDNIDKTQSENNSSESLASSIVFSKNGSESKPILKLEIYPQITGVLVVAEGANDEKRRLVILNAVSVALNIENTKIEVLAAEKNK